MKILDRRVYGGPNVYALYPVVRLTVDLGPLDERFCHELPGFNERLLAALPRLSKHGCCYGEPGGFVRRLETGTLMGHILEHVAIALQNTAIEPPVSFGKTRTTGAPGEYHVVYATRDPEAGLAAADAALAVLQHCWPPEIAAACGVDPAAIDPAQVVADFVASVDRRALGPSTSSLVAAAEARGIPWRRLDDGSLIELGTGKYARRICATLTEQTGCIATDLASDKQLAARVLREAGLPAPVSEVAGDAAAAVAAAERIGFPVAVKPLDGNHGRGVRIDLRDAAQVREAAAEALRLRERVVVQSHLPGYDHRLLVVDGRLVAAARRVPAHVIGDGMRDVRALVDAVNAAPERGHGHDAVLTRISLDNETARILAEQALTPDSVPERGRRVWLQRVANLSRGGTAEDVTDRVHPDNVRVAERAARALRLDVAGVDFVIPDIAASWREVGGGICEVNAAPGFRMHLRPSAGQPRDVAGPVLDMLFPPGAPTHVPITALTGTNGKTTTARMLAHIQRCAGRTVGLTTTDGVYVDGELLEAGDLTGPGGARMALSDPRVDSAVLEVARGGILRAGLGFDACEIGAVLNVGPDHLGIEGVETVEDMAHVKRVIVEVATNTAVLNADDPNVAAMAPHCRRAREICWVSRRADAPIVRDHVAAGGSAVVLDRDLSGAEVIALLDGDRHRALIATADIPATLGGVALFNVDNAMFAAALARAGGIAPAVIRDALRTFNSSFEATPGRLNVYDEHPFRVILDYCHNAHGYRALGQLVDDLEVAGSRILVFGMPGNRRDRDLTAAAAEAAPHFDLFIVHDDDDRRGRAPLEVPNLIVAGLRRAGVPEQAIAIARTDEAGATELGLRIARPGDLVVRLAVDLERAWQQIQAFDAGVETLKQSTHV